MFRGVFRNTKLWVLRDHITFCGGWGGRLPNIIGNLSRWRFGVCNTRFRILILGLGLGAIVIKLSLFRCMYKGFLDSAKI